MKNLHEISGLDPSKLPSHVAIIMDGNGRWAKQRFLNRIQGHEKGADTVRMVVRTCREIGIDMLTLYAFSTENWQRPKAEVKALMELLKRFLNSEIEEMLENNIRLNAIGEIKRLPQDVQNTLQDKISLTQLNTGLILNLALSYGGRSEIVRAVKEIVHEVKDGRIELEAISAETVAKHLFTKGMSDPDLLIRTSGEMRISNFMLWQIAYTEIFITSTLWPDFSKAEFIQILIDFQRRERRFGKV